MGIVFTGHGHMKGTVWQGGGELGVGVGENLPSQLNSQKVCGVGWHAPVYAAGEVWCFETARKVTKALVNKSCSLFPESSVPLQK